jgi:hypothetical protein
MLIDQVGKYEPVELGENIKSEIMETLSQREA